MRQGWMFVWRWIGNLLRIKALWELLPSGVAASLTAYFASTKHLPLWITILLSIGAGIVLLAVLNLFRNPDSAPPPADRGPSNVSTTHGSQSPIIHGGVHGPVTFNQGVAQSVPKPQLTLGFYDADPQCKQQEPPFAIPQHLFRVRVDNGKEGVAHKVRARLETVPSSLPRLQGVLLQVRHHTGESEIDIGIDDRDYFDFLLYNSQDQQTKQPVLFITHHTPQSVGWNVPVADYEFTLRAYSAEATSNFITVRFSRTSQTNYRVEQIA